MTMKRWLLTIILTLNTPLAAAAGSAMAAEEAKGPQGGKLLTRDGLSLEITIFEQGIPPEMRVYAYFNDQPISPETVNLEVDLSRLGGDLDALQFTVEGDYLVGDQVIREPHSYDVAVRATHQGKSYEWQYPNHEGRAVITPRLQALAELETAIAGPAVLRETQTLFGVIAPAADRRYELDAPYPSTVQQWHVNVGDSVTRGQVLATLRNTQTLQTYSLKSPAAGEVTARPLTVGQRTQDAAVIEITDLSRVWVELSAFPEHIERLRLGQSVTVYDLHQHETVATEISYIAPQMTGGHIARARAVIPNPDGHWRPGMHLKADVEVGSRQLPLAVRVSALQSFREMPVVFAKFGDTFEVRMVELGTSNGEWLEVLGGLKPGTEYVTGNSFLLKADVLKDGASHDH